MSSSQHSELLGNLSSSIPNSQMFATLLSLQVLDEADELQNRPQNKKYGSLQLELIDHEGAEDHCLNNSENKGCKIETLKNRIDSWTDKMEQQDEHKPENYYCIQNSHKKHPGCESNENSQDFKAQKSEKYLNIVESRIESDQSRQESDNAVELENIDENDYQPGSCVEIKNKSTVNRDQVRENFEILLSKVYGIIEEIEQKNQEALMAKYAVQQKIKYDKNVVSVSIGATLTQGSDRKETCRKVENESAIPTTRNPNINKKIPKLFLYEQVKHDTEISVVSHRNLCKGQMITYQDTQILNTARSQCSRRSNRSSRGINVVSTRKNTKNSSSKKSNYIALKPKSNEKKLNTFNLQSNKKEKQSKKKIKLCHKRFSGYKQNNSDVENRAITPQSFNSPKTETPISNRFNIKNYFNAKRVSFRLF